MARSATTLFKRRVSSSSMGVLPMFQAGLPAREELATPLREFRGRHPVASTEALERLPLEPLDDDGYFPPRRPPPRADERRQG